MTTSVGAPLEPLMFHSQVLIRRHPRRALRCRRSRALKLATGDNQTEQLTDLPLGRIQARRGPADRTRAVDKRDECAPRFLTHRQWPDQIETRVDELRCRKRP